VTFAISLSDIPDARFPWLRPTSIIVVAALHALVFLFVAIPKVAPPSPVDTIEIDIAPPAGDLTPENQAEATPDSMAQPEVVSNEKPPDPDPDPQPPVVEEKPPDIAPDPTPPPLEIIEPTPVEPPPPIAAEPPKIEAPDAPVIPVRAKPPRPKPFAKPTPEKAKIKPPVAKPRPPAAQSAAKARSGVRSDAPSAASRATFGAKVMAAIRANRVSMPMEGTVGVAFVVGASGSMTSASIISSSGNPALDSAALRTVRGAHPGPPPGGAFANSVSIHFNGR
jgi:protein TonB